MTPFLPSSTEQRSASSKIPLFKSISVWPEIKTMLR